MEVFKPDKQKTDFPKRNNYDLSFQSLLTTDYGRLTPCFVAEVQGGESFRHRGFTLVRSIPIVFPVMTRIKGYVHFFYVRNRILHSGWEDLITGLDMDQSAPTLKLNYERAKKMISTGSLGDYLNVPSTVGGDFPITNYIADIKQFRSVIYNIKSSSAVLGRSLSLDEMVGVLNGYGFDFVSRQTVTSTSVIDSYGYHLDLSGLNFSSLPDVIMTNIPTVSPVSPTDQNLILLLVIGNEFVAYEAVNIVGDDLGFSVRIPQSLKDAYSEALSNGSAVSVGLSFMCHPVATGNTDIVTASSYSSYYVPFFGSLTLLNGVPQLPVNLFNRIPSFETSREIDATDDVFIANNKFVGDTPQIPLSALPFRAYEMIYNYFYRNSQNNPYNPTGNKIEYNKFIPTTDGGQDTNVYELHYRNWELDPFTSAVPSPQFGDAPLVGISYQGGDTAMFQFQVTDGDGNTKNVDVQLGVDPDTGNILAIKNYDDGVPSGNLRNLMDLSTAGFSINTLRNVNAFQHFLEDSYGQPLRYRDQYYAHFGVKVDYPDIDVPEFIGGYSGDLVISQVTNLAEGEAPLGDVSGKIDAILQSKHPIKHYCPEHGWIIGVLSIVPVPTYSQTLPTYFTRYKLFDWFNRRFGKIGYVPIFHKNFMPLQSNDPESILGYQRAWWDYMSRLNEVHGDFRTSYSDFVLMRRFKDVPTLNKNFTIIDPDSLTNIFAVDKLQDKYGSSDPFICAVYNEFSDINPVPKHGRMALE